MERERFNKSVLDSRKEWERLWIKALTEDPLHTAGNAIAATVPQIMETALQLRVLNFNLEQIEKRLAKIAEAIDLSKFGD